jgi:small-conductance mechanosensitive channel
MATKKYTIILNICAVLLMALIILPMVSSVIPVSAQGPFAPDTGTNGNPAPNTGTNGNPAPDTGSPGNPAPDTGTQGNPGWIKSPLSFDGICGLMTALINLATEIGAIVGVLALLWTGFLFITARGNPEKLKFAKSVLKSTLIGIIMLLGASLISKVILGTIAAVIGPAGTCGSN